MVGQAEALTASAQRVCHRKGNARLPIGFELQVDGGNRMWMYVCKQESNAKVAAFNMYSHATCVAVLNEQEEKG